MTPIKPWRTKDRISVTLSVDVGRGPAARTAVNGGVIAARCPACGAELRLGLDGTCTHCKASVTNGSVDWVVVECSRAFSAIRQIHRWDSRRRVSLRASPRSPPRTRIFSLGIFEGRVKTAFLALQDAWCKQRLDAGRAFMSPGAYFTGARSSRPWPPKAGAMSWKEHQCSRSPSNPSASFTVACSMT